MSGVLPYNSDTTEERERSRMETPLQQTTGCQRDHGEELERRSVVLDVIDFPVCCRFGSRRAGPEYPRLQVSMMEFESQGHGGEAT